MPAVVPVSLRTAPVVSPRHALAALVQQAQATGARDFATIEPARRGSGFFVRLDVQISGAGIRRGGVAATSHPGWFVSTSGGAWRAALIGPFPTRPEAERALFALIPRPDDSAERATIRARCDEIAADSGTTPAWTWGTPGGRLTASATFPGGLTVHVSISWAGAWEFWEGGPEIFLRFKESKNFFTF